MKTRKFSLIEILVVIAIIAILAALLMPAITTVRNNAKKAQAKAQMNAIMTAIKTYESTYGVMPVTSLNWADYPASSLAIYYTNYNNLMNALTNVPDGSNSRKIRFLDVPNNYTSTGYIDPWTNKYQIYIDTDYNGSLAFTDPVTGATTLLYGSVFITDTAGQTDPKKNIYSWK